MSHAHAVRAVGVAKLLIEVADWLSGQELFLRTGYGDSECAAAIDELTQLSRA
jgi:hypothetical protein